LVGEDEGGDGTAEQESWGTVEPATEQATVQAARGTAVAGGGDSRAEMMKKTETWEDVFLQVKKSRGLFKK
jgi:hypothetical protein